MKKKARGMFALVEGDCEWVIFSGRNYKVLFFVIGCATFDFRAKKQ